MRHLTFLAGGVLASAMLAFWPQDIVAQSGLTIQQHTTFNIAKISSGDITQTVSILGADRARTVTAGKTKVLILSKDVASNEITRLDKDSVYTLNDKKKEYTAKSLADVRAELAKVLANAEKQNTDVKENKDVKYTVIVDEARNTGERQTINGFATERVLIKLRVMAENTKTGVTTLTYHMTADAWIDRAQSAAGRAFMAFQQAQAKALGVEPTMAANPYARFLTDVNVEMARLDGYPIRTTLTIELPADTTAAAAKKNDPPPTSATGAVLGAMFGGNKKKDPEPASPNGGFVVFTSMTETTRITLVAPAAVEFEIPAGYVKK